MSDTTKYIILVAMLTNLVFSITFIIGSLKRIRIMRERTARLGRERGG